MATSSTVKNSEATILPESIHEMGASVGNTTKNLLSSLESISRAILKASEGAESIIELSVELTELSIKYPLEVANDKLKKRTTK